MAKRTPVLVAEPMTRGVVALPASSGRTVGSIPATGAPELFPEVEQGSDEWFELRRGIPTASEFACILAGGEGKMRQKYLDRLAGEILSEHKSETYRNSAMDRGNAIEPELRERYVASRFCQVTCVGFVRRKLPSGRWVGGSPDALVDHDGVLEIKSHKPEVLIPILDGRVGSGLSTFRAQCQGLIWLAEREWCDIRLGYWGHPMFAARFERDDRYIRQLSDAVEVFDYDLNRLVERLRGME